MSKAEIHRKKAKEDAILMSKYRDLFTTPVGKEVLIDLFKFCRMNSSTYQGNTHDMVFNEGARSVALRILQMIKTDHESYMKLVDKALAKGEYHDDEIY